MNATRDVGEILLKRKTFSQITEGLPGKISFNFSKFGQINYNFGLLTATFFMEWLYLFNSFISEVPIVYKQVIDLQIKSMDWFLYDNDLHHERVKTSIIKD